MALASGYRFEPVDPTPGADGALMYDAGPVDNREREARPDVLTFTTEPLEPDLDVVGVPRARLWMATTRTLCDVVRLCDVDGSGRSVNITDGLLRLTHHELDGPGPGRRGVLPPPPTGSPDATATSTTRAPLGRAAAGDHLTSTGVQLVASGSVTRQPMQPPARQPIGFWTSRAGDAIRARTRGALGEIGMTQPEWWVLHQLSLHPEGVGRAAVVETIGPNETAHAIETAIETAIGKRWIHADGARLFRSESGTEQFERAAEVQTALQDERMEGITTEDFATTITVLQRTIANVGGDAWHW